MSRKQTQKLPGSIYRKGVGQRFYWRVQLPGSTEWRQIPLTPVGEKCATTNEGVAREVAWMILEAAQNKAASANAFDGTIGGLVRAYRKWSENHYVDLNGSPTTQVRNVEYATEDLLQKHGLESVQEFGTLALGEVRDSWCDGSLCRSTVNARLKIIQKMFRWGVEKQMVPVHVATAMGMVSALTKFRAGKAAEPKKIRPVPVPVVQATIKHAPPVIQDMVTLQLLTGMRSTEVCYMRPGDIARPTDDGPWTYNVDPNANKCKFKGEADEHDRKVALVGAAKAIARKYLLRPAAQFCFTPAQAIRERHAAARAGKYIGKDGELRPSYAKRLAATKGREVSERFDRASYRKAIVYAIRKANREAEKLLVKQLPKNVSAKDFAEALAKVTIPHWHPHQLRHTAATIVRAGLGDKGRDASLALLGQKTQSMADVYAEIEAGLAVEAATTIHQRIAAAG